MARAKKEAVEPAQVEEPKKEKSESQGLKVAPGVVLTTLAGIKCEGEKVIMSDLDSDFANATKKAEYLVSKKKLVKA
jgi:hypothetical protein